MKILSLMAGMLIFFASTISPTSLNGRFVVLSSDSSKLAVKLQINTNTGTDDLGGATIVIGFNKTVLNFSSNPIKQNDFVFHNFSEGNYGTATVTRPMTDKIWINIDLPQTNSNKGMIVSGKDNWTDIVSLYFNIAALADTIKLNWLTSSPFWGVYDGDNKTLWTNGELTNLEITVGVNSIQNVDPNLDIPSSFELSQNYPNPFNPSTKIIVRLPQNSQIKLTIYNMLGEVISEVANGEFSLGSHEFEFDATGLASGIYVYKIECHNFIESKKMIVMK